MPLFLLSQHKNEHLLIDLCPSMSEQKGEAQHVLVAVTGSVAAIKVPELVEQLTLQQETKVVNQ